MSCIEGAPASHLVILQPYNSSRIGLVAVECLDLADNHELLDTGETKLAGSRGGITGCRGKGRLGTVAAGAKFSAIAIVSIDGLATAKVCSSSRNMSRVGYISSIGRPLPP